MIKQMIRAVAVAVRGLRHGEALEPDETVVLFPQSASQIKPGVWQVPLHAWVVELEQGSITRRAGQRGVLAALDLLDVVDDPELTPRVRERLNWFMADREMNKRIEIRIGDQKFVSPRSPPNGHIRFTARYKSTAVNAAIVDTRVAGYASGRVQLVGEQGVSLISDIDDTIKISNVTDKKQLVRGFFFDDYHVVDGMPQLYWKLQQAGVCFHYVSASPWQLYPSIAPLLEAHFPFGSLSQRHFYIADRSFVRFFMSSETYKINAISNIIERFPRRRFILVGDSGERDPRVYATIAQRHSTQIKAIFIRRVEGTAAKCFTLPEGIIMQYFDEPSEINAAALAIAQETIGV